MHYFLLKRDFWVAKWLKKPSNKEIEESVSHINKRNIEVKIGIDDIICNKVMNMYIEEKRRCIMYGKYNDDFNIIACRLQLPKPIVMLILEKNGISRGA